MTHLPDIQTVNKLVENAYSELTEQGKIIFTFRDLTFELKGADRFIPVRNDDDKIFTCFLEYETDYVAVYDIVYEREEQKWEQKISSYRKIRISEEKIKQILLDAGFQIDFLNKERGLITVIGSKQ